MHVRIWWQFATCLLTNKTESRYTYADEPGLRRLSSDAQALWKAGDWRMAGANVQGHQVATRPTR